MAGRRLVGALGDLGADAFVADTAVLIYRAERRGEARLLQACDELFDAVELGEIQCVVGVASVTEFFFRPIRHGPGAVSIADAFLRQPSLTVAEFREAAARLAAGLLASRVVRRLADALIAATALHLGLPLVTADRRLARSGAVEALLVQDFA
jgi:predicted nucleic acid-binding protein